MRVFVLGFPHDVGGASGEAYHAALLWRRNGLDVTWIPTWAAPSPWWEKTVRADGMDIIRTSPRDVVKVPDIAGAPVVMFCNNQALACVPRLQDIGCRIVAVPCMCFHRRGWRELKPHSWVCQSFFQRERLRLPQAHVIRGAYAWDRVEFAPLPHSAPSLPFTVGRIARAAGSKWNEQYWRILERIPNVRGLVMGVNDQIARSMRPQPEWAKALKENELPAGVVMRNLHAYLTINSADVENWPRVGLEAMAHGVPLVVERKYGWAEMLTDDTAMLSDSDDPLVLGDLAAQLAADEGLRLRIAAAARKRLEEDICNPATIWDHWQVVLGA